MPQYKNVLSWLESEYLLPAMGITQSVLESSSTTECNEYPELKDLEAILEKALQYIRRHQN